MRRRVVVLGVVDVLLLVTATAVASTTDRDAQVDSVRARPRPAPVTPTGPWTATLDGSGPRFTMTRVVGAIPDALDEATFRLPKPDKGLHTETANLTLPDGTAWQAKGTFRLEAAGPLAFTSVQAREGALDVGVASLQAVLGAADGPVTAVGTFVGPAGQRVDRLPVPAGTGIGQNCGRPPCSDPKAAPVVSLRVGAGVSIQGRTGSPTGEVAVAGTARGVALGRTWDGLVGSIEGTGLEGTATWDGRTWSVSAQAGAARQVWMDVWPVADTTLSATSEFEPHKDDCFRDCPVRIRWANTGWATSQILEAEGIGPGSTSVRFGLTGSTGHDAGLGISRGEKQNLGGGDDIGSSQEPGQKINRGLSTKSGSDVTLVLRGNFPEVRVPLAVRPV